MVSLLLQYGVSKLIYCENQNDLYIHIKATRWEGAEELGPRSFFNETKGLDLARNLLLTKNKALSLEFLQDKYLALSCLHALNQEFLKNEGSGLSA